MTTSKWQTDVLKSCWVTLKGIICCCILCNKSLNLTVVGRRHFQEEMNANKEVKLIFNGHVLKQNQHSLQSCGLFHNCVVHCLIHQKRPSIGDRDRRRGSLGESAPQFFRNNNFPHILNVNNNNQGIEYDLGNFLYAGVSFILLAAWYFR